MYRWLLPAAVVGGVATMALVAVTHSRVVAIIGIIVTAGIVRGWTWSRPRE